MWDEKVTLDKRVVPGRPVRGVIVPRKPVGQFSLRVRPPPTTVYSENAASSPPRPAPPPPPPRARTHRRQSLLSCRYRVERTSRQLHGVPAHRPRVELIPGARPVVPRAAFIRHGPGSRDDTGDTAARLFYSGLPAPCTPAQHRLIITLTPPPIVTAGNVCRF